MRPAENPFSILGVGISATSDDVLTAWKAKVKLLHPDRYPEAPPEIIQKLTEELARVNAAHDLLENDLEGLRLMFSDSGQTQSNSSSEPSGRGKAENQDRKDSVLSCEVCGSLHTEIFSFTRQVGLIFMRRVGTFEARLCKNCALAFGRSYQSRTIATGWWGMISFFANIFYVLKNSIQLNKALRLSDPEAPHGYRTSPMDPGHGVLRRPITWVGPIIFAVLLVVGSNSDSTSSQTYQWEVGNCVVVNGATAEPTSCDSTHSGRIVDSAVTESGCPSFAEGYVDHKGLTYCIDTDL